MQKNSHYLSIIFLLVLFAIACTSDSGISGHKKPKYVFLFIGDGMGVAHATLTNIYLQSTQQSTLAFKDFEVQGLSSTRCVDSYITDSGAGGTAIACGEKTNTGFIGVNADNKPLTSIAKLAKQEGLKVGILTTVSIDHATPASFYAQDTSRNNYYNIAQQLWKSDFDYFAGGGFLLPNGIDGKKIDVRKFIVESGYTIVSDYEQFTRLSNKDNKIVVECPNLDEEQSLPLSIDAKNQQFTLAKLTKKAIEVLDNDKGFFMMVEGGKIDWASHANDAASMINELIAFDNAIKEALEFQKLHPDETLIVVTADHETGGLSVGCAKTKYKVYLNKLQNQTASSYTFSKKVDSIFSENPKAQFTEVQPFIQQIYHLTSPTWRTSSTFTPSTTTEYLSNYELEQLSDAYLEKINPSYSKSDFKILYGGDDPISVAVTRILNTRAGVGWTTFSHTGHPVGTYAQGAGSEVFYGFYENTEIFDKLKSLMDL